MSRKIWNYFKMAGQIASSKKDVRHFLVGAIGLRSDGVMVESFNSPTPFPVRQIHAEYRLLNKLDYNSNIYVARLKGENISHFGMSAPCADCAKYIRTKKVNRVYYTINDSKYGIWDVKNDNHKICSFRHL